MSQSLYKYPLEELKHFLRESGCLTEEDYELFLYRLKFKAPATQFAYLRAVILFCSNGGFKGNPIENAKETILQFESKNSRMLIYYALKFLFTTLGKPFQIFREEIVHGAKEGEITELKTFTDNEIERLIDTALELAENGEPIPLYDFEFDPMYALGLILVSTIYGTRRGEYYILEPDWIRPDDNAIYIRALKHSVSRKHLIPFGLEDIFREIKKVIDKKPPDARYLNTLFDFISAKAEIRLVKRRNIHSIRKTVASKLLMSGLNPVFVNDFLRWKGQGTMLSFYANLDPIFIDTEVFKSHPYVEMWKRKLKG